MVRKFQGILFKDMLIAMVKKIGFIDKSWVLRLKLRYKSLVKFIEEKASVSINGVSLTISKVTKRFF